MKLLCFKTNTDIIFIFLHNAHVFTAVATGLALVVGLHCCLNSLEKQPSESFFYLTVYSIFQIVEAYYS